VSYTAKITAKGQVTVPKPVRDQLNSDVVEFEVKEDHIEMRAVKRVAGVLSRFANPDRIPEEAEAWKRTVRSTSAHR
jgi:AbrB family looped-hinge helix DNA binding protein